MINQNFIDYYKMLNLEKNASPESIQKSFEHLSKLYNPHKNRSSFAANRMVQLKKGISILKDHEQRSNYNEEYDAYYSSLPDSENIVTQSHPATKILHTYLSCLQEQRYEDAYNTLCDYDKEHISLSDFIEWQDAVKNCYEIKKFDLKFFKNYYDCEICNTLYGKIIEFSVILTDRNKKTLEYNTQQFHKYIVCSNDEWKVSLGLEDLKHATLHYQKLETQLKTLDPVSLSYLTLSHKDPETDLLTTNGFFDEAAKEVYRNQRYHNPFSLVAFQIIPKYPEDETACFHGCADILKSNLRMNDLCGLLPSKHIICLLAETKQNSAYGASRKLIRLLQKNQVRPFDIHSGMLEYRGFSNFEDAVFAACSYASLRNGVFYSYNDRI